MCNCYEQPGFIDCSGICFEASLADTWIGDGFCDGVNAQYGVNFLVHFGVAMGVIVEQQTVIKVKSVLMNVVHLV